MPNFFQKLRTDRLALDSRVSKECVDAFLLGDKFWDEYCLFSVRDKKIYGFSVLQNALTQYRIIYMLFETKRHVDLERQFILSEIAIVEEELLSLSEVSAFDMAVKTDVGPDESDVKQWKVEIEPLVVLALKPPMTAPVSVVATSAGPVLHERFIKNAVSASHLIWQGIPKSSPPRPPVHRLTEEEILTCEDLKRDARLKFAHLSLFIMSDDPDAEIQLYEFSSDLTFVIRQLIPAFYDSHKQLFAMLEKLKSHDALCLIRSSTLCFLGFDTYIDALRNFLEKDTSGSLSAMYLESRTRGFL